MSDGREQYRVHEQRPILSCCDPTWHPGPSGWAWWHGDRCPSYRGRKVVRDHVAPELHPFDCDCDRCAYLWAHADDEDDDGRDLLDRRGAS